MNFSLWIKERDRMDSNLEIICICGLRGGGIPRRVRIADHFGARSKGKVRSELGNLLEGGRPRPPFPSEQRRTRTSALQQSPAIVTAKRTIIEYKKYSLFHGFQK